MDKCRSCRRPIDGRIARIFYGLCGPCYGRMAAASEDDYYQTDGQLRPWARPAREGITK